MIIDLQDYRRFIRQISHNCAHPIHERLTVLLFDRNAVTRSARVAAGVSEEEPMRLEPMSLRSSLLCRARLRAALAVAAMSLATMSFAACNAAQGQAES